MLLRSNMNPEAHYELKKIESEEPWLGQCKVAG